MKCKMRTLKNKFTLINDIKDRPTKELLHSVPCHVCSSQSEYNAFSDFLIMNLPLQG